MEFASDSNVVAARWKVLVVNRNAFVDLENFPEPYIVGNLNKYVDHLPYRGWIYLGMDKERANDARGLIHPAFSTYRSA